jgi:putative sorbose PTS system IIC component
MAIEVIQNILVILLSAYVVMDNLGITVFNYWSVTTGMLVGLIMGDIKTGLYIGGTFQLMSLGVAGLGGASVPDYGLASLIGTFLAVRTGANFGTAMTVALPVGLLAINFDVLVKILNNFVAHRMHHLADEGKYRQMLLWGWAGPIMFMLKNIIIVTIVVLFGPKVVDMIVHVIPVWVTNGLNIAGGLLPVLGVALLLHYMPVKRYFWAVLVGFVCSAYLKLPIIAVSLFGAAAAMIVYQTRIKDFTKQSTIHEESVIQGGDDYDE